MKDPGMRRTARIAFTLVMLLALTPRSAMATGSSGGIQVVDQSMNQSTNLWQSIIYLAPIGQEFTPRIPALDAVELYVEEMSCSTTPSPPEPSAQVWVNIRQDTIFGPIKGTSSIAEVVKCFAGVMKFDFTPLVRLQPGHLYVIDVSARALNPGVYLRTLGIGNDTYPGGQAIALGAREEGTDMWFREGLSSAVPTNKDYCKENMWPYLQRSDGTVFKNQGDCIQYVNTGK